MAKAIPRPLATTSLRLSHQQNSFNIKKSNSIQQNRFTTIEIEFSSSIMKHITQTICILIAYTSFLVGCATTTSNTLSTSKDFESVFSACKQTATECGFGITSASATDGFISASQGVYSGQGSVVIMNIQVTRKTNASSVLISVVPPPGTVGNIKSIIDKFTTTLKGKIPDIVVSAT